MNEKLVSTFTLEDGQEYFVLDRIKESGKTYLFLVSNEDDENYLIQEYKQGEGKLYSVREEEFDNILQKFEEKNKNLRK